MATLTPYIEPYNTKVYAQYTLHVEDRELVQKNLREQGLPMAVYYPVPLHLQPVFGEFNLRDRSFHIFVSAGKRVISAYASVSRRAISSCNFREAVQ